jgi:ABC-2 type transport system ATP-binding protein
LISEREDGFYILTLNGYSQMEDVLVALRLAKTRILEMEILQPNLEEVFVTITGSSGIGPTAALAS